MLHCCSSAEPAVYSHSWDLGRLAPYERRTLPLPFHVKGSVATFTLAARLAGSATGPAGLHIGRLFLNGDRITSFQRCDPLAGNVNTTLSRVEGEGRQGVNGNNDTGSVQSHMRVPILKEIISRGGR